LFRRWRSGTAADVPLFAALWLLAELARGVIFTGFPWVASGYAQVDAPLAVLAPWVGVYGIGAVGAALSAALALPGRARRAGAGGRRPPCWRGLALAGPGQHTQPGRDLSVQLLQPNVAQDEKFAADRMPATLQWVASRLIASRADLVVAPETAVPLLPASLEGFAPGYWQALQQRFAQGSQAALVGVPLGDFERGYTNSVAGLSAGRRALPLRQAAPGAVWRVHPVRLSLVHRADAHSAGRLRTRGTGAAVVPGAGRARRTQHLLRRPVRRRTGAALRRPGAGAHAVCQRQQHRLVRQHIAVDQHLAISRLRALEFQLPMLRATNTGATAVIDHQGRVQAQLQPFTEGVLDARVQARHGVTPFAWWSARAGLWPWLALALAVLGWRAFSAGAAGGRAVPR
jgi:apolipoprotein N-acyltransferase